MDNVLQYIKDNISNFKTTDQLQSDELKYVSFKNNSDIFHSAKVCFLDKKDYIKLLDDLKKKNPYWKQKNIEPKTTRQFKILLHLKEGMVHVFTREYYAYVEPGSIFQDLLK